MNLGQTVTHCRAGIQLLVDRNQSYRRCHLGFLRGTIFLTIKTGMPTFLCCRRKPSYRRYQKQVQMLQYLLYGLQEDQGNPKQGNQ